MFRKRLTILIVAVSMMISCGSPTAYSNSTPLPGWNSPVTELLVEKSSFPEGWGRDPLERSIAVDVRVNNVSRTFFNLKPNRYGKAI